MLVLHTGNGSIVPRILYLDIRLDEWSVSRLGRFTLVERDSGTHYVSEWMDPRIDTLVATEYQSGWLPEPGLRYPLNIRLDGFQSRYSGTH